jgi:predicted ATPase
VVEAAPDIGELLARCPGLAIMATSRTVLGLQAEWEYPVPPLPLPADPGSVSVTEIAASPAVALFVDRARAVRPGFALTEGYAAAVAEICRRLEGLPLAIELAAARTRLLDPPALLDRLAASLDSLGTGAVDLPERQRTLRATVQWSISLLDDAERSLLEVTAVFADGWTVQAASAVAGLDEDRVLELSETLARHSLVYLDSTGLGPRSRMLETVRKFVAEQLALRPDAAEIGRRHADYYRALAEQADRPLRGPGRREWMDRLQGEAGNLAAAVRWYLAHDRGPLPHLFRVLWLFWSALDLEREAWPWVEQVLPGAGALDPQARVELAWVAAVTARRMTDRGLGKELGEGGVDLAGGQQGGAVALARQLDVPAAGNPLGCFAHGPRGEPAVMLERHGQAGGLDLAEPVQLAAVLEPGKIGLVLAEPPGVGPRCGGLDQADGDLDRVIVVLELGHGMQGQQQVGYVEAGRERVKGPGEVDGGAGSGHRVGRGRTGPGQEHEPPDQAGPGHGELLGDVAAE